VVEQRAQSKTEAEAVKDPTAATRWSERLYTARLEVRTLSAAPIFLITRDAGVSPVDLGNEWMIIPYFRKVVDVAERVSHIVQWAILAFNIR